MPGVDMWGGPPHGWGQLRHMAGGRRIYMWGHSLSAGEACEPRLLDGGSALPNDGI